MLEAGPMPPEATYYKVLVNLCNYRIGVAYFGHQFVVVPYHLVLHFAAANPLFSLVSTGFLVAMIDPTPPSL